MSRGYGTVLRVPLLLSCACSAPSASPRDRFGVDEDDGRSTRNSCYEMLRMWNFVRGGCGRAVAGGGNDRGARTTRKGHPRPVIGALFRTRAAAYMPAARSWSRSRRDVGGECCGRFSPSGAGASSWRCLATVRLATMAAMAMRLTPKVRISPPIWKVRGAPSGATVLSKWQIPCRTIVRFRTPVRGVTQLMHNPLSLLVVREYNARDICFRTTAFSACLRRPLRAAYAPLSLQVDSGAVRLAGHGGGAHIGRPNRRFDR